MSDDSKIEWTDATWNPVTGCTKVSPGCDHCYAETFAERWRGIKGHHFEQGFDVRLRPERLEIPLHWKRPRRIFVNSMSDVFHESVPSGFIACMFAVMAATPQHTYQVLTKRHGRMRSLLNSDEFAIKSACAALSKGLDVAEGAPWPLPNVWLGVSTENQKWANIRIPALLDTPAAVRFVSAEPLLGPIRMRASLLVGRILDPPDGIGWVIGGGESGPGARPCEIDWLRSLRDQCIDAGVPVFIKQLGSVLGHRLDAGSKGGDWSAWPEDLRIREFPRIAEEMAA